MFNGRIMIVEDESFVARDLQMCLEGMGYTVDSMVPSGELAIREMEKERSDLVLMDIVLQGEMDGIETAEEINSRFDIPVIFITAHGEDKMFERAKITEPLGYIVKPFNREDLQKAIEIGLYKHRAEVERKTLIQKLKSEIAERKKMEEALLQSEKFKSLGTIAAGIAHEFNNILAIIMGYAELLNRGSSDNRELKKKLAIIIKACEDGADIARRMLRITDADEGGSEYLLADIQQIIDQAIEFTEPRRRKMAQGKDVEYHIGRQGVVTWKPVVKCNPVEMREVFVNIINNALNAMPNGGVILLHTRKNNDNVLINVTDTGHGMTGAVRKRIFDPFFTTRCPEGTGLGMSIVYGTIKRHGGELEVQSRVGEGTSFLISIPMASGNLK